MSFQMNSLSMRSNSPKLQKCQRCELNFLKSLDNCTHCSELNDVELLALKKQHEQVLQENAQLGKYFFAGMIVVGALLVVLFQM